MKYTTKNFRVDGKNRTIEFYRDTVFIDLYRTMVYLWSTFTDFSKLPFPNEVTAVFPITKDTKMLAGRLISW